MRPRAAQTTLPLLPRQAGEQLVDGVVDGAAGDNDIVPGGGHDMEDVGLLPLGPPALAEAVSGIRRHPAERDAVGDGPADHRVGGGHLRGEGHAVRRCRPGGSGPGYPPRRWADTAAGRSACVRGRWRRRGTHRSGSSRCVSRCRNTAAAPRSNGALLQEAGVIDDQGGLAVCEVFDDIVVAVAHDLVSLPVDPVQQPADAIEACVPGLLRRRPAVLPLRRSKQPPAYKPTPTDAAPPD